MFEHLFKVIKIRVGERGSYVEPNSAFHLNKTNNKVGQGYAKLGYLELNNLSWFSL